MGGRCRTENPVFSEFVRTRTRERTRKHANGTLPSSQRGRTNSPAGRFRDTDTPEVHMTTNDTRAARALVDATHADADAHHAAAQQRANAQERASAQTPTDAPPSEPAPAPTDAPAHLHEQASARLDLSDPQGEPPPGAAQNPLDALRSAVTEYKDTREHAKAEDSKAWTPETARRWARAHKDAPQPHKRKRGRWGFGR